MTVGKRIQYFREKKNLTVNRLANMAGISQSYLRDLELENKQPTVEYLSYICDALHISLHKFFSDEETDSELTQLMEELNHEQKEALLKFLKLMTEQNR